MERTKYFQFPHRVQDILGGRKVMKTENEGLACKIDKLAADEALVITGPIVPGGYGNYPLFEDPLNFMKRGRMVLLRTPSSLEQAIEEKMGPTRLRIEKFDYLDSQSIRCGYSWNGIRSQQKRIAHLDDVMTGMMLFSFCEHAAQEKDQITLRAYDSHYRAFSMGGAFLFNVPSMSREDISYMVRLSGVPIMPGGRSYAAWFDLQSAHACEKKANTMTFRYNVDPEVFCQHDVAAFMKLAKHVKDAEKRPVLLPFPIPTESTVWYWRKLREQVMVEEKTYDEKGKMHREKRPLNFADREVLLWQYVGLKKHKATFYARNRVQDYAWK
ncbi:MAG TPA: hypothetical protein VJJ75_02730 [Candidatus Nanoarchaeia archaeon]|nr:hypothetical protein [Candidatus Nanoarchaeia archaeon]